LVDADILLILLIRWYCNFYWFSRWMYCTISMDQNQQFN